MYCLCHLLLFFMHYCLCVLHRASVLFLRKIQFPPNLTEWNLICVCSNISKSELPQKEDCSSRDVVSDISLRKWYSVDI